jgi:hypothetical protein
VSPSSTCIRRRETRLALRLPVRLELEDGRDPPAAVDGWAEELSGHGFRLRLDGTPLPDWVELERPYPARLAVGRGVMSTMIEFVWRADGCWGVRFWQQDRVWPVR